MSLGDHGGICYENCMLFCLVFFNIPVSKVHLSARTCCRWCTAWKNVLGLPTLHALSFFFHCHNWWLICLVLKHFRCHLYPTLRVRLCDVPLFCQVCTHRPEINGSTRLPRLSYLSERKVGLPHREDEQFLTPSL